MIMALFYSLIGNENQAHTDRALHSMDVDILDLCSVRFQRAFLSLSIFVY